MSSKREFVTELVDNYGVDVSKALQLASAFPTTSYDGIFNVLSSYGDEIVDPILKLRSQNAKEDEVISCLVKEHQIDVNAAFDISEMIFTN